ncbi:DUF5979 domain-containing protein [Cellulosimicrobium sp. SH8]|uniref:DUF5979 domain-containing protein n=1 Tax=Cellulosimicrobium sp. SH8 TaxID=2952936 RepID=UPI0021F2CF65|nr:DUF5979 domain-containing protein [Cellulosimicrobium sp. SH8]
MPPTARPPRASTSPARRALAGAVALLLALLGLAAVPTAASATELDAITGVEITRPTGEIHQWDSIRLDATWAVPDGSRPGDTFRLALPTSPRIVGFTDTFDLTDPSGAVVGSCTVDESQFVCTLGDYVATHTGVAGTLFFWAQVTETTDADVLVFTTGGGVEIRVDVPGGIGEGEGGGGWQPPTYPVKGGWYDRWADVVRWDVYVPGQYLTGPDGDPVVLTDTFDPRLTLVEGSVGALAVPVDRWDDGDFWDAGFWMDPADYVVEPGPAANQFRFSVPDAHGADYVYVLTYATAVPDDARDGDRYENTVTGLAVGDVEAVAEYAGAGGTGGGEGVRSIRLAKQVDGDAAEGVTGPFGFELACTGADGETLAGFPRAATLSAGTTTTFAGVPVGAVCGLTETDDGGADRVSFAPAGPIEVTAGSPATIDVVATNTFDAHVGGIAVTKRVTGAAADAVAEGTTFSVGYAYGGPDGEVTGDLVVTDGATAALADLPAGTVVTLSEAAPTALDGVVWRAPSFSGEGVEVLADGAARVVAGDGTTVEVVLTNEADVPTVPVEPGGPGVSAEPPVPGAPQPTTPGSSGALAVTGTTVGVATLAAALLVATGVMVVVARRRTRV